MDKVDNFKDAKTKKELKKQIVSVDSIPEKVVKDLYDVFLECDDLHDKLNTAYAIAEFYK